RRHRPAFRLQTQRPPLPSIRSRHASPSSDTPPNTGTYRDALVNTASGICKAICTSIEFISSPIFTKDPAACTQKLALLFAGHRCCSSLRLCFTQQSFNSCKHAGAELGGGLPVALVEP